MIKDRRHKNQAPSFFTEEDNREDLSNFDIVKRLGTLNKIIPWNWFRPIIKRIREGDGSTGGRPPYDEVLMAKILIFQEMYGLSDEKAEFHFKDSNTLRDFIGVTSVKDVPDRNTIRNYREKLQAKNLIEKLFNRFNSYLEQEGFMMMKKGSIVDATFIEVPRQRNTREEDAAIKDGKVPESFESKSVQERSHKDVDAAWAVKNKTSHYGYKLNANISVLWKLIISLSVTRSSDFDGKQLGSLLSRRDYKNAPLYADSAYSSRENLEMLRSMNIEPQICEKGYRNKPLTKKQIRSNRKKSRIRSRVEHIFGDFSLHGGKVLHTIGIERARAKMGLRCLAYNMRRFVFLKTREREKCIQV